MKYRTKFSPDTTTNGPKLIDYLAKDDLVIDITGIPLDDGDLERWRIAASQAEMVRQHAAMMADTHSIDELAAAGRTVAREHLDGTWAIGVHYSNPGEPHIHLAEFGTEQECRMNKPDIDAFRRDLAAELGESIGTAPPSADAGTITAKVRRDTDADPDDAGDTSESGESVGGAPQ